MPKRVRLIVATCCLSLILGLPVAAQTARRVPSAAAAAPSVSLLWNRLSTTFVEMLHRLRGTFAQDGTGVVPPPPPTHGGNTPGGACDGRGGVDPWGCA